MASGQTERATVTVRADRPGAVIHRNIYGHFAEHLGRCIYEGIWVGEDSSIPNVRGIRTDVAGALKDLGIPVLRWPGGCFADEYHWKDGIGPREERPGMINTHWGGVVENNHFGTHEFLDLCEQIDAEPYICGNVGSGTPQEMMEWVEYLTSDADTPMTRLRKTNGRETPWKVTYFGVGNESWGCGGNMRPEYYADNYRRFNTFCKNYSGNKLFRIACGPNSADYNWTEVLTKNVGRQMHGLSLHYYTVPTGIWDKKGASTGFGEDLWHSTLLQTLKMDEMIRRHSAIMDRHDPEKKIGLIVDEWGTWYDVEPGSNPGFLYQQNTLRDALVAALNFNIFHAHADRVVMANIAQTINVLQALILTDGERMLRTPTYHAFDLYKPHRDATSLAVDVSTPDYRSGDAHFPMVHATASRNEGGQIHISLVNTDANRAAEVRVSVRGAELSNSVTGRVLTADTLDARNTFDAPDSLTPKAFSAATVTDGTLTVTLPPASVVTLAL